MAGRARKGNHETNGFGKQLLDRAPFYFILFRPNGEKTYFARQIGLDNVLFVLDTDHIHSSDGEQLDWMKEEFSKHNDKAFRFASYHISLYPSVRKPDHQSHVKLRKNWLPVFDRNRLIVAFENHDHALKKSWSLKENQVTETGGTYYLGDGNWGTRSKKPRQQWYLEATGSINHVWSIELLAGTASFKALTIEGIDNDYTFEIEVSSDAITK